MAVTPACSQRSLWRRLKGNLFLWDFHSYATSAMEADYREGTEVLIECWLRDTPLLVAITTSDGVVHALTEDERYATFETMAEWLRKLGKEMTRVFNAQWAIKDAPEYVPELLRFPRGYSLINKQRSGCNRLHWDNFLVGHPGGGRYDRVSHFVPHLLWLLHIDLKTRTGERCKCLLCKREGKSADELIARIGEIEIDGDRRVPNGTYRITQEYVNQHLQFPRQKNRWQFETEWKNRASGRAGMEP